jgi:hypothetical protein
MEIKAKWQNDVIRFKQQRKPYLLYAEWWEQKLEDKNRNADFDLKEAHYQK